MTKARWDARKGEGVTHKDPAKSPLHAVRYILHRMSVQPTATCNAAAGRGLAISLAHFCFCFFLSFACTAHPDCCLQRKKKEKGKTVGRGEERSGLGEVPS